MVKLFDSLALLRKYTHFRYRRLIVIVLFIITAVLMGITPYYQSQILKRGTEQEAIRLARLTSQNHREVIESAKQLLSALASLEEVKNHNQLACSRILIELVNKYPR